MESNMKNLLLAFALIFGLSAAPLAEAVAAPKKEHTQKHKKKKKHHNRKVGRKYPMPVARQVAIAPAPVSAGLQATKQHQQTIKE
jgi:hypothetical protein